MGNSSSSGSTGKQVCISLRGLSHEVCVAATRAEYWRQLVQNSSISIRGTGNYVPVKLESMCNDEDEARLQLIINSQAEQDNQQIDDIYNQIRSDLKLFEHNDAPVYNYADRKVTVFGSLFNSLPMDIFNPDLHILGREYCNITKIKKSLACSIIVESLTGTMVDSFMAYRYRFIIHNEKRTTLDFAVMQIQALVHQAQHSYFMMYSIKIGRTLGIIKQMETGTSNQEEYSSSTAYKPTCKRKRTEDEEQQLTISQSIYDSDQTDDDDDDEIILDDIREQQRQAAQRLLNRICARMQARARKDTLEEAHEDPTTIKSYFRTTSSTKATTNDSECAIDLLSDENERLQKQVIVLEHHVQLIEEQSSIEKETCPEEVDCTKSSTLSLDVLLSNLIKQTTAIAENTSTNLFDLFQRLTAMDISDVKQSKQKLSDISRSQAAEQVQMALRCGVEHLSSSFSKAQSTYAT
ncbi:unnamed protein product [Rotaria sp. Silwood1]|nr:unnamed protein product [Rotaria sp. Silwood1]CAF1597529.1 unnamed protein product [Rotaria sp. Silwood1]